MPKTKSRGRGWIPPAKNALQLKITLRYVSPPIWRRVKVPDNLSLGDLHCVIQTAMGWYNCHLHAFRISGVEYTSEIPGEDPGFGFGSPPQNEDEVLLSRIVRRKGQQFTYEYDFGDTWLHEIRIEKITPATEPHPKPVCLAGKRACPPEDCGGVPGYAQVLHVLRSAKTADECEFREWLGEYDPERFDLAGINQQFNSWK